MCAFANTNGGTIFVGLSADAKKRPVGIQKPSTAVTQLQREISNRISPQLVCQVDTQETKGKKIIRILVPRGEDPPYVVDDSKIYVRGESETGLAVRDEIVPLVLRGKKEIPAEVEIVEEEEPVKVRGVHPPRTGVEVVGYEERNGTRYYTMRDLRNGNVVKNVTESSARRLWHYAISEFIKLPMDLKSAKITWKKDIGLIKEQVRGKRKRFDLAQKSTDGIRVYFGVTEDGVHGDWKQIVGSEAD